VVLHLMHIGSPLTRLQNFFRITSFIASISNSRSASSFFSRALDMRAESCTSLGALKS